MVREFVGERDTLSLQRVEAKGMNLKASSRCLNRHSVFLFFFFNPALITKKKSENTESSCVAAVISV